jgi:hypothetical protein
MYGVRMVSVREYVRRGETTDWNVDHWGERLGEWKVECVLCGHSWTVPADSLLAPNRCHGGKVKAMFACNMCGNGSDFKISGKRVISIVEYFESGEFTEWEIAEWGERLGRWEVTCRSCGNQWELPEDVLPSLPW